MPIDQITTASLDSALNAPTATALSTASGSAPSYSARAWVNFNGTGTVAIRASGNVSSITDNGTGEYTVNFTTAMPNADYSFAFGKRSSVTNTASSILVNGTPTTSAFFVATFENNTLTDANIAAIQFFR